LIEIPGYIGNGSGSTVTRNAAEVLNSGLEFNIRWNDHLGDIRYSVGLMGNTLHNEVKKISGLELLTTTCLAAVGLPAP
jgi:hypothetical protein